MDALESLGMLKINLCLITQARVKKRSINLAMCWIDHQKTH